MRRLLVPLLAASSLGLLACEDGPTQTFKPAPQNAGDRWNDGQTPSSTDTQAKQGFGGDVGGTNKQELCSGPQKAARWAEMVKEPIVPPTKGGGLDLAGGDSWQGLTIEEAEKLNCQSENDGDEFGDGTQVNQWGDNGELWIQYRVSNRKALQLTFWPGYLGSLDFKSRDGQHTYKIAVSSQIQKDGHPFVLDWVSGGDAPFDELYRAMMATYAPGLPVDAPGVTCASTGRCIRGNFGDVAYFYIPSIGWALWIDNMNAPQPTPSIPTRIDQSPAKVMPFAYAKPLLKLDQEGPVGSAGLLGNSTTPCTLRMGTDYSDFLHECVQVTGDPAQDKVELNKLVGGLSHSSERFSFDVQGIDLNFTDNRLSPTDIVHDKDLPAASDTATEFSIDQSTMGAIQNDLDSTGKTDLHGSGAIYKEYLRLVRQQLLKEAGIADGDVKKCLFPSPTPDDFDPDAFMAHLPAWCTGFEGMLTAAPPTRPNDPNNLGMNVVKVNRRYAVGMRLGHQQVSFCADATGNLSTGYQLCQAPYGATGDIFSTSFARVLAVFGKGKLKNLPTEVQDVRFFFKQYMTALVKYLQVGDKTPVPDLAAVTVDPNNLFFDSEGSGQFELGEYVDRRFATATQNPTDFVFVADVKNGIFDAYSFSRDLYRGEEAIYAAVRENPADALGKEDTALLSNIFGSPVLKKGWVDSSAGMSAYYCATNLDPAHCDGQLPPLDQNGDMLLDDLGRPVLAPYKGAFGEGATSFGLGPTAIKVVQTFPNIQQAQVSVPITKDPYDPSSPATELKTLVPWLPKQPGVGFPVALSGTLDKFVETSQLDFSGTTISANIDYDVVIDPATHQPAEDGSIQLLAVETTDFLGDVFLCQDPQTGDLLRARMYTPVANIMDWLARHPNAYEACGIVVRYSPYDNFVDYITSLTNGVRLGVTQGGGFGRVVDVTLFVPGQ